MGWLTRLIPKACREWYWRWVVRRDIANCQYVMDSTVLGKRVANDLLRSRLWPAGEISIQLPGFDHPLFFRPRTSDVSVIRQVFVRREYAAVENLTDVRLILDCGANIGCTSFLLLHAYPNARVIAVEPDKGNMALCRKNLAPFKDRVTLVESGVWDRDVPLKVVRGKYRDGQEWSFQVQACTQGEEHDFLGVTIDDLLNQSGQDSIDLLKMDIEGAEKVVFSGNNLDWIGRTRVMVIEIHDYQCHQAFEAALSSFKCELAKCGELTVCKLDRESYLRATTPQPC